jgi:hypothetical protein
MLEKMLLLLERAKNRLGKGEQRGSSLPFGG